jgi:dihydrolipoamide dehydrogenase
MRKVDIAVIGAGTAGLAAFRNAKNSGLNAVLIEKGPLGTTCARTGCMPSKLLIAASTTACTVARAGTFGIEAPIQSIDGRAVMERVRRLRDEFVEGTIASIRELTGDDLIEEQARFVAPRRIEAGGETIEAERVVISVGSVPVIPDELRKGVGERLMTIADLWEMPDLPRRMIVFGAGVIGTEASHALAKLGVEVTCLSKGGEVAGLTEPEVTEAAKGILGGSYCLRPDVSFAEIGWRGDELVVHYRDEDGQKHEVRADAALVATGRKPSFGDLGLEEAGLALEDGEPQFDALTRRCEGPEAHPVFIAGDADGDLMVLPNARREGERAGESAVAWPDKAKGQHIPMPLQIVFTEPAAAVVGEPYAKIKDRDDLVSGSLDFSDQGRARCEDRAAGLVKVFAEKATGRFVGAEMMAPDAEHFAHLLAWGAEAGLTVGEMAQLPIYHPVTEEGLVDALKACADKTGQD